MTVQELISEALQALAENARHAREYNIKGVRLTVQGEGGAQRESSGDPARMLHSSSNRASDWLDLVGRSGKEKEIHLEVLER